MSVINLFPTGHRTRYNQQKAGYPLLKKKAQSASHKQCIGICTATVDVKRGYKAEVSPAEYFLARIVLRNRVRSGEDVDGERGSVGGGGGGEHSLTD